MGFLLSNYQLTICVLYSLMFCLSSSSAHLCRNDESTALLQFKQLFSFNCSACECFKNLYGPYNPDNWKEGTDCCAWDGVTCDNTTSHVIGRFTNLTHLYLFDSHLSGPIQSSEEEVWQGNNFSNSIFHLQKLKELLLYGNRELTGNIPSFINGTLRHLRLLHLYETGFTGELPNSIGQLEYLEELDLHDCNFSGTIPRSPKNLSFLDLSHNNFEGPIPPFSIFSQLSHIDFSNNHLTGPIPSSIPSSLFHLVNLTHLDLSSNNLSGTVELDMFAKFEYLDYLDLSNSGLSLTTTNSTPSSFRNIETLRLSSCNISKIPEFLKARKSFLDMLDLSNNHLNEELSPLCNRGYRHLDLSNNQFAGLIPSCLGNLTDLFVLNLQRNNFCGSIPETFGYASELSELDISHNGLQGVLPRSLANCMNLEILNLGHNLIEDTFPFWLENLAALRVIVLRDNKFYGPIEQPRNFTNLHIIDMSHNDFTGSLPTKYFECMHSMMMDDEDKSSLNYMGPGYGAGSGYYSVTIMNKGLEMKFERIISIFKAVDFSYNKFHGNIPISIGRLKALRVLNFSSNGFTGPIPFSLGDLTQLESLDLSQNKLSGEIPQQLTKLTFLEVLNFSQNNLTGLIPRGRQFETFLNTSYEGNLGLCGFPLSKNCGNVQIAESPTLPSSFRDNFKFKFDGFGWEAVLMGYGCGVLLGLLIGSYIIRRKEEWLIRIFGTKMRQHGKRSIRFGRR